MIVTLTPNPSIDRAVFIDALRRGEVHRATSSRIDPGGKGVNVSRALAAQGADTVAVLPSGGPEGHLLDDLLNTAGVAHASVPVSGAVRMNISVLEPDGTTTKLNEPGPTLSEAEVAALLDTAGVAHASVPVRGTVRMNISVLEPDGTTTKLNEPGPDLSRAIR